MARGLKYARNALGLLAGVVISLTAVLYFVDFNEYRGLLATRLSEELGRPLRIDGDLKLRLGLHTGFSASGLSLAGNADGSGENMAKIGRLSFGLALRPLLDRKIEIDQLQIEDAEILIEQAPDGSLNWALGQGGDATSAWSLPRIDDLRVVNSKLTYRGGGTDRQLTVKEFSLRTVEAGQGAIALTARLDNLPLTFDGWIDTIDALLDDREIQIEGKIAGAGATVSAKGRVFQPLAGKGVDFQVTGRAEKLRSLLRTVGIDAKLQGPATIEFNVSDRDGPLALHDIAVKLAPGKGINASVAGRIGDIVALSGLALTVRLTADDAARLSQLAGTEIPPLGRLEATARLTGTAGAPGLDRIDGKIRHDDGSAIDFQGAVRDVLGMQGVGMHVTGRTERIEALLPIFGMEPLLQGRSEIAFDLKDKDGAFALRNVKVELQPAPGVEIAVDGHIKDALALTGLDLAVRLQADDAASLSRLAGTEIPSISPVKARGRIVGTAAEPAIADLTLTAGSVERIMLTVTGSIAEPLKADGLVLKLRLQGPDSGALSSYASLDVPALGRFDLAGRLRGSASSARLSRIAGQFRHHNGMTIDLQGSIGDLQKAEKLDLGFGASIPGGNALGDLLALEMPLSDRLRAKGRVSGSAETMRLVDLDITMGGSDLAGEVAIDLRGDRPAVTGDLHSKRLDLSFLSNQEEPANQTKPVADSDASQRLIPDLAVDPGFAAMLDGGLKYRAARLNWDDLALSGVNVTVDSKGGVLTLNPSTAELAAGQLIVDGRMDQEGVNLTFDLRRAAMKTLGPMLDMTAVEGSLDLRGDLRAQGRDLRALAGSLNGTASVVVGQGYLHNSYLEPLVKDLVVALVEGDLSKQGARLHCFANGYEFKNGVAVSQVLLLDTDSVTVVGEGQVDLSSEAIKYHLNPRPKNPSLLSLATPVDVSGTLAQPTILPDSVAVAGGVATAVVGNLLLPGVGLLLPLLSAGTGEDNPCLKVVKNGKAKAAEKTTQPGALGQLGDAVSEGAGALLKLPGKLLPGNLLGSE